jgi:hypothetical protein
MGEVDWCNEKQIYIEGGWALHWTKHRECNLHVSASKGNWEFNYLITVICNKDKL